MPRSVHQVLIHGSKIIAKNNILPISSLSEEAAEARNKEFRNFRSFHVRKTSRIDSNRDLLNMLLCSSDPYINNLRRQSKKPNFDMPRELLNLIKERIIHEDDD